MPQITKLQAQENPKFINIFLDHQYAFSLPLEEIYRQKLNTGLQLTKEQIENLIKLGDYTKLLDRAIKYISLRPRSEHELTTWLTTKVKLDQTSLTYQKLIEKLKKINLINDSQFADWWIEQRTTYKPRGPKMLYQELIQKGIDKQLVKQKLSQLTDPTSNIRQLATKKWKQITKSPLHKTNTLKPRNPKTPKLINFLLRKGYTYSQIKPVIDELIKK